MRGSKPGSVWERLHARINESADNFFYGLGYWVATNTKRTLFISLVLVIACCQGFANFRIEADGKLTHAHTVVYFRVVSTRI